MRLLILILLFPFISQGQIIRANPFYRPSAAVAAAGCSDADAQKFIDSAGITDQVRALNTIVEKFNDALGRGVQ